MTEGFLSLKSVFVRHCPNFMPQLGVAAVSMKPQLIEVVVAPVDDEDESSDEN